MTDGEIGEVLVQRGRVHGDWREQAACAWQLKRVMRLSRNGADISGALTPMEVEALEAILCKVSRILTGDPRHRDHWVDIAGYATLVSSRIVEPEPAP